MDYKNIAEQILSKVGGKENVSFATFCATRLRLTLKDKSLIDENAIESMKEVYGVRHAGAQFQIIIGQEVRSVYEEFCKIAELEQNSGVDEKLDSDIEEKKKITFKSVMDDIMDVVSACIAQVIPILITCGLLKLFVALFGPKMLNVLDENSDIMRLLTFVADAGFYFYPVFLAYGSAKKFKCSIPMALFMAAILIHPTLVEIVKAGDAFTVFGIPMILNNYTYSFLPILLIVWIMSYVEKTIYKYVPQSLKMLLVPLLTTLIMLPLALCVIGPIGTVLGQLIANVLSTITGIFGPIGLGLAGGLFPFLIATGMHMPIVTVLNANLLQNGYEATFAPGTLICTYTMIAIGLAAFLKSKSADDRTYNLTSFITMAVGGISEPTIFGIIMKSKKAMLYVFLGGFAGGVYVGITKAIIYFFGSGNFLAFLRYGGTTESLINGAIGCAIGFAVTFILAMVFGFDSNEKKVKEA